MRKGCDDLAEWVGFRLCSYTALAILAHVSSTPANYLGFLADPHHPQSALNAIPREVLRRAKGALPFFLRLW